MDNVPPFRLGRHHHHHHHVGPVQALAMAFGAMFWWLFEFEMWILAWLAWGVGWLVKVAAVALHRKWRRMAAADGTK